MTRLRHFLTDTGGAVSVENALLWSLVGVVGLKSAHCITVYCLMPVVTDVVSVFSQTSV